MTAQHRDYKTYNEATLPGYLVGLPAVVQRLGGEPGHWRIREVGDGNLNLVFLVHGPAGGVAVKQALPYVRLVGESWPLPLSRIHYEYLALTEQARHVPGRVPEVYHHDESLALLVMELLEPHIILRRGMIQAIRYPCLVGHISEFLARTWFFTSDLFLGAADKKAGIARFIGNTAMARISEDLIFTEPYYPAPNNRWTSPQLDDETRRVRGDRELKIAVSELKLAFMGNAQALIHGDLHTGSIMVCDGDTRVIDPEFAGYGPMGFDLGAVLANLLLNYFSQDGHAGPGDSREDYQEWVLAQVVAVWQGVAWRLRRLWNEQHRGDAYPAALFGDDPLAREAAQTRFLAALFADALGFTGAKMIRRLLGLAHNIDLEWIEDPDRRASCERRGLRLGRELMVQRQRLGSIHEVAAAARELRRRVG